MTQATLEIPPQLGSWRHDNVIRGPGLWRLRRSETLGEIIGRRLGRERSGMSIFCKGLVC